MDDVALVKMNGLFAGMYKPDIKDVRPSIAPEKLLRAGRSERQFVEQIQYSLLFCCFAVSSACPCPNCQTRACHKILRS